MTGEKKGYSDEEDRSFDARRRQLNFRQESLDETKGIVVPSGRESSKTRRVRSRDSRQTGREAGMRSFSSSSSMDKTSSSTSTADRCSLEVEEPVRKERPGKAACRPAAATQQGTCRIAMEDHCHRHLHRSEHSHHHRPAPIIVVPPINDESTRCNCQNCQFFSGWFCCIPLAMMALAAVLITWLVLRNRSDDWKKPLEVSVYSPTSPMDSMIIDKSNETLKINGVAPRTDTWFSSPF